LATLRCFLSVGRRTANLASFGDVASFFLMASPLQHAIQQSLRLLLDHEDLGADLLQRAQRLRLVEVPREADLVADLGGIFLDLGIERVRPHLAAGEGLETEIGASLRFRFHFPLGCH